MSSRNLNRKLATSLVRAALTAAFGTCGLVALVPSAHAALGGAPMSLPAGASVSSQAVTHAAVAAGTSAASSSSSSSSSSMAQPASGAGAGASYTVRQITLQSGTVVREYVSAAGTVFGVAWNGPQIPPLDTLLGSGNFSQYVAGVKAARAARGGGHGPGIVDQDGLVVHSGGHMGAFTGEAWLQQALPAGVTSADIQ